MRPSRSDRLEEYAAKMRGLLQFNRGSPVPAGLIATSLGLPSDSRGQAVVRDAARHLNIACLVPVVSDERGFWIATTAAEVLAYREALLGRNRAVFARCEALKTIAGELDRDHPMEQRSLFEVPAARSWDDDPE